MLWWLRVSRVNISLLIPGMWQLALPSHSHQTVPTQCSLKQKRIVLKSRCGQIDGSSRRHRASIHTSVRSLPVISNLTKHQCNNDSNSHTKLVDGQTNTIWRGSSSSILVSQGRVWTGYQGVILWKSCQGREGPRQVGLGVRSGGSRARPCRSRGLRHSSLEARWYHLRCKRKSASSSQASRADIFWISKTELRLATPKWVQPHKSCEEITSTNFKLEPIRVSNNSYSITGSVYKLSAQMTAIH